MGKLKSFKIRGRFNAGQARAGNSDSPLLTQAIAPNVWNVALKGETHDSLGAMCLPYREKKEGCF